MKTNRNLSRGEFIRKNAAAGLGAALGLSAPVSLTASALVKESGEPGEKGRSHEPVIDIHQHVNYHGRSDEKLLKHQRDLGVTQTILLPAGRQVNRASTHQGTSNGLGGVQAGGNEWCYRISQEHPDEFLFGANEVPDIPEAIPEIEKYLERGAKVIGEQKFGVECDSREMQRIYELAEAWDVPVLMHWQHGRYNFGFGRFHRMLEKYPNVNFIGHAQTWWVNIDRDHEDQSVLYPSGPVAAGGLTDRLLADYPNLFGDLSAGSGLNSMNRDEEHARGFLERHQDKLLYGSDCADPSERFPACQGADTIATIRKLSPDKTAERKILCENAKKLFRL